MTVQPTRVEQAAMALPDLRARAIGGFVWSAIENWGARGVAFATSLVLARMLSPELFGIAAAAGLVLALVPLVAEFGFSDAIIQRRGLRDEDVMLPFGLATGVAVGAAGAIVLFSETIAAWLGIAEHRWFLVAIACTVPLAIPLGFQDAIYRRRLHFRLLAVRGLVAAVVAGAAGIAVAFAGFGLWTFVVQAWLGTLITLVWLWWRPLWKPTWRTAPESFGPLLRFGLPTLAQRLVYFASTRMVDVLIATQIGLAAYGLYALGSKLYQTLLELLQGAFFKVTFSLLSQISDERERVVNAYEETVSLAASVASPVFVLLAVLSPEIADVLFDARWTGIEDIMRPLMLLGAVLGVQHMNGAFLSAAGKPGLTLITGVTRSVLVIAALFAFRGDSAQAITWTFVFASLAAAPLSFFVVTRTIGASRRRIATNIFGPWLAAAIAYVLTAGARTPLAEIVGLPLLRGVILGGLFTAVYMASLWVLARPGARRALRLGHEISARARAAAKAPAL